MSTALLPPITPSPNYHWTGANQRRFLEHLARDGVVSLAAKAVSMSAQAAYELRRRSAGRVFALGWLAAILVSRDRLFDDLMERAFLGQEEEVTRDPDNNRLVRKRIDNRLGQGMLTRLDRMVSQAGFGDAAASGVGGEPLLPAARIVAGDFERFLDIIEREGGGAEAGLFLAAGAAGQSDAFHCQLAQKSAGYSVEPMAESHTLPAFDDSPEGRAADLNVWHDEADGEWRTDFPPPKGFDGEEQSEYGEDGYERTLTEAEAAVQDARQIVEDRPYIAAAHAAREAWFAPEAEVKAEMRRRAAEEKAQEKAAAKAQASLSRLAVKRQKAEARLAETKLAETNRAKERAGQERQECSAVCGDDLEIKAAEPLSLSAPDGSALTEVRQTPSGYRSINMPQKPRPLFGIYGDKPPGRDPVW
jgi:hypothetical protein